MSTKAQPGAFDCYAKLGIDEPYFVIRAKDPVGAQTVRDWVRRRSMRDGPNNPKLPEALDTADAMDAWRTRAMSGKSCGCDPAVDHLCDRCADPNLQEMRRLLAAARADVNADLWTKLRDVMIFAASIEAALGDISIEVAKHAITTKAVEIFTGFTIAEIAKGRADV